MIPFQLSPVDTRNSVRKAMPKLEKVACLLRPSHGLSSLHSAGKGPSRSAAPRRQGAREPGRPWGEQWAWAPPGGSQGPLGAGRRPNLGIPGRWAPAGGTWGTSLSIVSSSLAWGLPEALLVLDPGLSRWGRPCPWCQLALAQLQETELPRSPLGCAHPQQWGHPGA